MWGAGYLLGIVAAVVLWLVIRRKDRDYHDKKLKLITEPN